MADLPCWLLLQNASTVSTKATVIHDLIVDGKTDLAYIPRSIWGVGRFPFSEICPTFWESDTSQDLRVGAVDAGDYPIFMGGI